MNRKHLAILATAGLVWSVSSVHATDGLKLLGNVSNAQSGDAAQVTPTDVSAAKKKKGKGGTKGGEPYMTIEMRDALITNYSAPRGGRPKGPPGGGLLGTTGGNFNPNPPAPTGTPVAPPVNRGAVIR